MTRPAQKWIGVGLIFASFALLLFTLAVPYVNHFGEQDSYFTYFTKWSGRWRSEFDSPGTFNGADELLNFPVAAPVLIGIGLIITVIGSAYTFWLTYSNKPCYFTRERPGPVGGAATFAGVLFYIIGSLIYESWAYGSARPLEGWPGNEDFIAWTVKISPTFWISFVLAFIIMALSTMTVVYYLDTVEKRPVK